MGSGARGELDPAPRYAVGAVWQGPRPRGPGRIPVFLSSPVSAGVDMRLRRAAGASPLGSGARGGAPTRWSWTPHSGMRWRRRARASPPGSGAEPPFREGAGWGAARRRRQDPSAARPWPGNGSARSGHGASRAGGHRKVGRKWNLSPPGRLLHGGGAVPGAVLHHDRPAPFRAPVGRTPNPPQGSGRSGGPGPTEGRPRTGPTRAEGAPSGTGRGGPRRPRAEPGRPRPRRPRAEPGPGEKYSREA